MEYPQTSPALLLSSPCEWRGVFFVLVGENLFDFARQAEIRAAMSAFPVLASASTLRADIPTATLDFGF